MGTIAERKRKNGSLAFLAQIVIKREGKIVHRENKTFDRRRTAEKWLEKREAELSKPEGLHQLPGKTLADAIDKYVKTSHKQIGRTKTQVLNTIRNEYDIASMKCADIDSQALVAFVEELNDRVSPQDCAKLYVSLGRDLLYCKASLGIATQQTGPQRRYGRLQTVGAHWQGSEPRTPPYFART